MKRIFHFPFLLIATLALCSGLPAQTAKEFEERKAGSLKVLERLLKFVEVRNTEAFAGLMIYSGPDKGRELKDRLNYNDPYEKLMSENLCLKLYSYWNKCVRYTFSDFKMATWSGNEMIFWNVSFINKRGKEDKYKFSFIHLSGNYWFWKAEE